MAIKKETKRMIGWAIVILSVGGLLVAIIWFAGWVATLLTIGIVGSGIGLAVLLNLATNWIRGE